MTGEPTHTASEFPLRFVVGYVQPEVRIKNCLKSTSAIKIATMKNTDDFCYKGKPSMVALKGQAPLSSYACL